MEHLRFAATSTGAVLLSFWIGLPMLIQLLVYAILLDMATGLLAGYINKVLDSDISRRGVAKKAMMLLLVAGSEILGRHFALQFTLPWGATATIGSAVAAYYLLNEAVSITENAARSGLPLPKQLTDALKKAQGNAGA